MAYPSLQSYIEELRKLDELAEVREQAATFLEITEIADREMKKPGGGKALLFPNNGTAFPLLINAFGSEKRILKSIHAKSFRDMERDIAHLADQLASPKNNLSQKLKTLPLLSKLTSWMPKAKKGRGACQQVVCKEPDLGILPVLHCWPQDGGPFITLPLVHTRDPEKGTRNVGMYRMQVFGAKTTGMHWHTHKTGAQHYRAYKTMGKRMPVSVALGGDPAYTYAATAPLPEGLDEYMLAGYLRKKKVELVQCTTNDLEVPADADIIIEGYVDTNETPRREGPFGDHTGFYSLADDYPLLHVTAITHRKNAVYPATIVGVPPMEDAWMAKATEEIFRPLIKRSMLPEMTDMHMPDVGVAHNLAIIQIKKEYPGHAQKIMHALWGAGQMMFNKIMVIVDQGCDIRDYASLANQVAKNYRPGKDTLFSIGPTDVLDHSTNEPALGSKLGIDATKKEESEDPNAGHRPLDIKIPLGANIRKVNNELLLMGIPVIFIGIHGRGLMPLLQNLAEKHLQNFKGIVVAVDASVEVGDLFLASWYALGNTDPQRDCRLYHNNAGGVLLMDGTNKKQTSDFARDWPNVVAMDTDTIELADSRWEKYGLGPFCLSPSRRYHKMMGGNGAVYRAE